MGGKALRQRREITGWITERKLRDSKRNFCTQRAEENVGEQGGNLGEAEEEVCDNLQ